MSRIAIVGGCRTAFVKAAGAFSDLSSLDLALRVLEGTCSKLNLKHEHIHEVVHGTVLLNPRYPNAARELVLRSNLPDTIGAHFVSNNCITGLVAVSIVAAAINEGRIKSGLAVGSESMSRPTLTLNARAENFFLELARAKGGSAKAKTLLGFRPAYALPEAPSPKEPSTGLTMGEHCELSAKEFKIDRAIQDELALRSHQKGAAAQEKGYLAEEILPVNGVAKDNLIRGDTSLEKLAKLKPVFDRSAAGTITAGNSSALTDGASAVSLMDGDYAAQHGYPILGYLEGVEFAAIKPSDGLLMAPVVALPKLFKRFGLNVGAIDLFEVHEAFAAQLAANLQLWESGWSKYEEAAPIGKIPLEKLNVNGGSVAIGHPFAATGGRLILSTLNELKRRGQKTGVISVCAAGAMACAALVRAA